MKLSIQDNTKLWFLLAAILIVGGVFFALFIWLLMRLKWWLIVIITGYLVLLTITDWIAKRIPGLVTRVTNRILSAPIGLLYIVFQLIQPFVTIIGTYLFVTLFAFGLPSLILEGLSKAGWLVLKPETIAFVVIALGSILCSTYYKVTKWIIHSSPMSHWGEHKTQSYQEELAVYLINPSNIVFLLYAIYFIYLGVSGFQQIQNGSYLISEGMDVAILKAFLVFIAFTNMRSKANEVDVDVKELVRQTLRLFGPYDELSK